MTPIELATMDWFRSMATYFIVAMVIYLTWEAYRIWARYRNDRGIL